MLNDLAFLTALTANTAYTKIVYDCPSQSEGLEASEKEVTGDELRTAYLSFFESKGHKVIPSSSLIPQGDPTLLLTSAGMVPFKSYFLGETEPPARRLASCQKCFRATDIESVGDSTHLTFFEMLGNFSIGDYFKSEAISWAWEFVTQYLRLPPSRLWITIFRDDDEAFRIWRQVGVPAERIVRLGEKDNFWGPAGDSGPCGPCSEIHYDFGEEVGCRQAACAPGCSCGRFMEFWNLVFTQYNQDKDGQRTPLPKPNIDTGMGLERTAAIMQGKTSVYETDFFTPLLECVAGLTGKKYGTDNDVDNAMRVVVEHSRGIALLIADGVMPSNEGRGYVLRRLLRRAQYFSETLAHDKPFIAELAKVVIDRMGHVYPVLVASRELILATIESEVQKFQRALLVGNGILQNTTMIPLREELKQYFPEFEEDVKEALSKQRIEGKNSLGSGIRDAIIDFRRASPTLNHTLIIGGRNVIEETFEHVENELEVFEQILLDYDGLKRNAFSRLKHELQSKFEDIKTVVDSVVKRISGLELFVLHDTYGFPVELTREIAASRGFSVDMEGFTSEMEKQRERARASHKFELEEGVLTPGGFNPSGQGHTFKSEFVGYRNLSVTTKIELINYEKVGKLEQGQEGNIILSKTPFYGEMGGQIGDTGEIRSATGRFSVTNTVRMLDIIVHQGWVTGGSLAVGDEVEAEVDEARRLDIARNHTATHLLQSALRQVLGEHIQQRGSLVAPDRLRFDFSHLEALSQKEIDAVQRLVNQRIRQNLSVKAEEMPYKKAIEAGVTALFGEKYGDVVRVLRIGRPAISAELCGGTHISTTGEIGFLHIIAESSIGAGLRRLEAVTGRGAEEYISQRLSDLTRIAQSLNTKPEAVLDRAVSLVAELDSETKRRLALERELARKVAESLLTQTEVIKGVTLLVARVPDSRIEILREMSDLLREKLKSAIVVLGTLYEDKPVFLVVVTSDLVAKGYDAGKIVREVAKVTGGGGGGKATLAQAGGRYQDKLDEALKEAKKHIEGKES